MALDTNLGAFVRQAVKNILIAQNNNEDTQAINKKCDEYTINLKISTKIGIVKSLPVRELLMLRYETFISHSGKVKMRKLVI